MPQSAFLRWMFGRVPTWVWVATGVIVVVCMLLGALINLRWIAVGMMALLIGVPGVGAWLYFDLGMRSATAFNVLPHVVTVSKEGINISVITKRVEECDESEVRVTLFHFGREEVKAPLAGIDAVIIPLSTSPGGFIWLPNKYIVDTPDEIVTDTTTTTQIINFVTKHMLASEHKK